MLKVLQITALLCFALTQSWAQQSASEYMKTMGDEHQKISEASWSYTSAVAHGKSARKVEKKRGQVIESIIGAKRTVSRMRAFDGNTAYRDSVLSFLNIHYLAIKEDYDKIIDMEAVAEQSYDGMEAYILAQDMVNKKLEAAGERLQSQQRKFAEDNGITLVEDDSKLSQNIDQANRAFGYYRQVYLIFFKCYIQEVHLLDAMNRRDISAFEQSRSALESYAEEGLEKLEKLEEFEGDGSIITAGQKALTYFLNEAQKDAPKLSAFYIANEKFGKIKKAFDAKRERDRTKEDIDTYNDAVAEVNAESKAFNVTNDRMNKTRKVNLEAWNKSVDSFLDSHTPH